MKNVKNVELRKRVKLGSRKHKMTYMKVKLAQPVLPTIKNTTPKKDALAIRSALLHAHHFQTIKPTHAHTHTQLHIMVTASLVKV